MITDGVDLYYGRSYDANDPYVVAAISDAQKAGVIVHSIFYRDTGRFDNGQWTVTGAQSYLLQVSCRVQAAELTGWASAIQFRSRHFSTTWLPGSKISMSWEYWRTREAQLSSNRSRRRTTHRA